ncbi:MAG: LPP20 family lipoprotein [Bacteroidaceae bacterium]|nr:LPP20 family lipoprotein [Bacteroidaceae bacterium]
MHRFIITSIICLLGYSIYAQVDINRIKNDKSYYTGEGVGVTKEEAHQNALGEIARQIQTNILSASKEKHTDSEKKTDNNSSFTSTHEQESELAAVSSVSLRNVEMMELSPEPEAKVFCWVHKSEVERMYEERKKKVLGFIKTGKTAEKSLQIDDALRYYYWALMLNKGLNTEIENDGEQMSASSFAEYKIKTLIKNLVITVNECQNIDNRYYVNANFKYCGHDVSSLQIKYFDGQSYVGPLSVRDGAGELELLSHPNNNKIDIMYEYMFKKEGESFDDDLRAVFKGSKPIIIKEAKSTMAVNSAKSNKKSTNKSTNAASLNTASVSVAPVGETTVKAEKIVTKKRIEMKVVEEDKDYLEAMKKIEEAIKTDNPKTAYSHFTPDGYKMFDTLLNRTGKVALFGVSQNYSFIECNDKVIGRFCKVSIKFKNGKKFMENLVFRFNNEKKIESLAFALTKKAEDDIFNADASLWKDVSRYAILQFMEDYQTAYALKRLDYIDRIFSDDAIIIVGSMLKPAKQANLEGRQIDLGNDNVEYRQRTKSEYLNKLKSQFKEREYIHLTFENNEIQLVNAPYRELGTVFAVQIRQLYNSSSYSDQGYLTLVFDASRELPLIGVRLWQPDKTEMIKIQDFVKKFKF